MPSSKNYKRDYTSEYANYHSSPEQKKKRASRGRARYKLMKQGRVKLGDNLDVDHKNTNANDNSSGNLRVKPKGTNRSFKRDSKARKA
jgi:nitrate reductase beta subunit